MYRLARAATVDRAAPNDGDVVQIFSGDQWSIRVLMFPLPATMDDRIIIRVFAAQDPRACVEVQGQVVSQEQAPGQIATRRQIGDRLNKPGKTLECRWRSSRHLLLHTADAVGAIARQVGFKDQAYFSRVFHKVTGMSPQGFREKASS